MVREIIPIQYEGIIIPKLVDELTWLHKQPRAQTDLTEDELMQTTKAHAAQAIQQGLFKNKPVLWEHNDDNLNIHHGKLINAFINNGDELRGNFEIHITADKEKRGTHVTDHLNQNLVLGKIKGISLTHHIDFKTGEISAVDDLTICTNPRRHTSFVTHILASKTKPLTDHVAVRTQFPIKKMSTPATTTSTTTAPEKSITLTPAELTELVNSAIARRINPKKSSSTTTQAAPNATKTTATTSKDEVLSEDEIQQQQQSSSSKDEMSDENDSTVEEGEEEAQETTTTTTSTEEETKSSGMDEEKLFERLTSAEDKSLRILGKDTRLALAEMLIQKKNLADENARLAEELKKKDDQSKQMYEMHMGSNEKKQNLKSYLESQGESPSETTIESILQGAFKNQPSDQILVKASMNHAINGSSNSNKRRSNNISEKSVEEKEFDSIKERYYSSGKSPLNRSSYTIPISSTSNNNNKSLKRRIALDGTNNSSVKHEQQVVSAKNLQLKIHKLPSQEESNHISTAIKSSRQYAMTPQLQDQLDGYIQRHAYSASFRNMNENDIFDITNRGTNPCMQNIINVPDLNTRGSFMEGLANYDSMDTFSHKYRSFIRHSSEFDEQRPPRNPYISQRTGKMFSGL